jgi:hypothetical protein
VGNKRSGVSVNQLMQEMAQAGVLLGGEGFEPSAKGARIRIMSGQFTVNDGPFRDRNGLINGYALVNVKSKAEALECSRRFLAVVGQGERLARTSRRTAAPPSCRR